MFVCANCCTTVLIGGHSEGNWPRCPTCSRALIIDGPIVALHAHMSPQSRGEMGPNEIVLSDDIVLACVSACGEQWDSSAIMWEIRPFDSALSQSTSSHRAPPYYANHIRFIPGDTLRASTPVSKIVRDPIAEQIASFVVLPSKEILLGMSSNERIAGVFPGEKISIRLIVDPEEMATARRLMAGAQSAALTQSNDSEPPAESLRLIHDSSLPPLFCGVSVPIAQRIGKFAELRVRLAEKEGLQNANRTLTSVCSVMRNDSLGPAEVAINMEDHLEFAALSPVLASLISVGAPLEVAQVDVAVTVVPPQALDCKRSVELRAHLESYVASAIDALDQKSKGHATLIRVGMRLDDGHGRLPSSSIEKGKADREEIIQQDRARKTLDATAAVIIEIVGLVDANGGKRPYMVCHRAGVKEATINVLFAGLPATRPVVWTQPERDHKARVALEAPAQKSASQRVVPSRGTMPCEKRLHAIPFVFPPFPPAVSKEKAPIGLADNEDHSLRDFNLRLVLRSGAGWPQLTSLRALIVVCRDTRSPPLVFDANSCDLTTIGVSMLLSPSSLVVVFANKEAVESCELHIESLSDDTPSPLGEENLDGATQSSVEEILDPINTPQNVVAKTTAGFREPVTAIAVYPDGIQCVLSDGHKLPFQSAGSETNALLARVLAGKHPFDDSRVDDQLFEIRMRYSPEPYQMGKHTGQFGPKPGHQLGRKMI